MHTLPIGHTRLNTQLLLFFRKHMPVLIIIYFYISKSIPEKNVYLLSTLLNPVDGIVLFFKFLEEKLAHFFSIQT